MKAVRFERTKDGYVRAVFPLSFNQLGGRAFIVHTTCAKNMIEVVNNLFFLNLLFVV